MPVKAFQSALDLSPEHRDALIGLGTAQFELGRYEAAVQPLDRALRGMTTVVGDEAPDHVPIIVVGKGGPRRRHAAERHECRNEEGNRRKRKKRK